MAGGVGGFLCVSRPARPAASVHISHHRPKCRPCRAAASSHPSPLPPLTPAASTTVLEWIVQRGATPSSPKLERRFVDDAAGWCLVATEDIEGDEVVLSVPLTAAITSEGADESRWSAHMAQQLLQAQAQAAGDGGGLGIAPWLSVLPRHVDLPWLYWSEEELQELQDEDTMAEAAQLRSLYDAACQELDGGDGSSSGGSPDDGEERRRQLARAMSLVHSRSFVQQGRHVWVPGIDLCNHTLTPSAGIRCVESPGACQGAAALDDVCSPEAAAAAQQEPSRFELVAGEAGIRAGQEVSISYGSWPSDVFLLFFGFVPADNPHDAAVLFYDLFDLATFQNRQADTAAAAAADASVAEAAVQQLEAGVGAPRQQFTRMVATAQGIDERLLQAAQALLAAGRGSPDGRPMSVAGFLGQRCRQLLEALPTSAGEDAALLREAEAAAEGEERELAQQRKITALRYRMGKKLVLQATMDALGRG